MFLKVMVKLAETSRRQNKEEVMKKMRLQLIFSLYALGIFDEMNSCFKIRNGSKAALGD